MTVMLERPPTRPRPVRSSRWAWSAILLTPVLSVLAIWMGFVVFGDENVKWWGDLIVLSIAFAGPVAAIALGIRSARSGNRLGVHATAVGAAWVAGVMMFWYAANYPYNSESGVVPALLGVVVALVVAAAIEAWYRFRRHGPGTT
jgi:energy-converting hydrogenase Eha subunit A